MIRRRGTSRLRRNVCSNGMHGRSSGSVVSENAMIIFMPSVSLQLNIPHKKLCIVWVSMAALVIYKTNFFRQVWENPKVNKFFLNLTLACYAYMITLLVWLSLIGPIVKGREIVFEEDLKSMVPVSSFIMVGSFITAVMAMWPVWGFLTPIYMLILTFGGTLGMILLPGGNLGNLCFWIAFIVLGYISHTMPHEPIW